MTDIAPIGGGWVGRALPIDSQAGPVPGNAASRPRINRGSDRVEVSRMASLLNQLREMPDVRHDLVARVREQIAAGDYDTPERIEGAIDGLLADGPR